MNFFKKMGSIASAVLMVSSMPCIMPSAVAAQNTDGLYINEVCTQNKNSYIDSLGKASDWIELYNGTNEDIDLSGFGLSDKADNLKKYVFPSGTVIKKGEYLIIISNKDETGTSELNTGFGLSKTGEPLILSSNDGQVIQKLQLPALGEDTSYGRKSDGNYSVMPATPGSENISVPSEPEFSMESGFYSVNDVHELTLSSTDTVYYTLDGSDPTTSETAMVYNGPIPMYDRSSDENVYSKYQSEENSPYSIRISTWYIANPAKFDKATIVRAAAKSSDGTFSRVTSKTFFVMDDEKLQYYKDIPVVSIVTDPDNLFDKDKGIYVAGQQYIDWLNAPENERPATEWANFFSTGKEWEREADITYFDNGSLGFSQKMGIRIRGASTRNTQAKSFNLYARSEYGDSKLDYKLIDDNYCVVDGKKISRYDSFGLRAVSDVYRLRENAVQSELQDLPDLATYDSDRCMLFIDGELWGMYDITEKASDYYIQSNYNLPSENVSLYKNGILEEGTDDDPRDIQRIGNFCRDNDLSVKENYDYVTSQVDIDSIIDHYCLGLYLGTWDWPNYNYFMWRYTGEEISGNPYSDGKWRFGSFDFDYSVGLTYQSFGDGESYEHDSFQKMDGVKESIPTVIFTKLLENPEFKQKFADRFCTFAYEIFEPSKMADDLTEAENKYIDYMTMTAWRWNNGIPKKDVDDYLAEKKAFYHEEMETMRTFFAKRPEYAVKNMQNYLGISNIEKLNVADYKKGSSSSWTAPVKDGKVFAGWFADSECTTPYLKTTGYAYAKFIDEKCVNVKWQKRLDSTSKDTTDIRLVSTLDSGNYSNMHFVLKYADKGTLIKDGQITKLYKKITGFADGKNIEYTPEGAFCSDSKYFAAYTVTGMPNSLYGTSLKAQVYFVTLDGTKVEGSPLVFKVTKD